MATRVELFASPEVAAEPRADGALLLRSSVPLGPYAPSMAHLFLTRAAEHPDRVLAAQRDGDQWLELSWGEAAAHAQRIASGLLARGMSHERPLMVLSGNGLE